MISNRFREEPWMALDTNPINTFLAGVRYRVQLVQNGDNELHVVLYFDDKPTATEAYSRLLPDVMAGCVSLQLGRPKT